MVCVMNLIATLCIVLLMTVKTKGDLLDFDDKNYLCSVCSCSNDGTTVDCSRRGLNEIPYGVANDKVQTLNLSTNEISTFPKNLEGFYNLVSLDLSGNRLSDVPGAALQNLTELETLDLSNNNIKSWISLSPTEILLPALKLKSLDLSSNQLQTMADLANRELLISSSLETLILNNCQIETIQGRSPISGLTNLKVLRLSYNPLQRIQNLISPTLRSIYASNCELSSINHDDFNQLPSLLFLKLANNYRLNLESSPTAVFSYSLKYLDISFCNVMHTNLKGFPNLRRAIIHNNLIRFLESNEFFNNSKLEYLDLSYNNIGSLKSDTFKGLGMLKYLDLSWNQIANIPENSMLEMPSLTQLVLARNYLTRVGHLKSLSVSKVDMSSCEISTIGKESLEGLQSLVDLDLSHNLLSYLPESISSNTLQYLNLNYNRISTVSNHTFFMLPRLKGLSVIGNRFTSIWQKEYFQSNPYLEQLELSDNMWRCECIDKNMYDFYEYVTLEPNKKEESINLYCNSPSDVIGQTWIEACYFVWNPTLRDARTDGLMWFLIVMITGLSLILLIVNIIRKSMNRRLIAIQEERARQEMEVRDRLRELRMRTEQQAMCNAPDPRDLISPPSYDEALSMPKLNVSCQSLNEIGQNKRRRRRKGRRKTKSSGDLLEETELNGDVPREDMEMTEASDSSNRRRRRKKVKRYGSHEITELDHSPGARRRRMSEYHADADDDSDGITMVVEAELERPLRPKVRRYSSDDDEPRESDF